MTMWKIPKISLWNSGSSLRVAALALIIGMAMVYMIAMPGNSHHGPLAPLTEEEAVIRDALHRDVKFLGGKIGERNLIKYKRLYAAADYIEEALNSVDYDVRRQGLVVGGIEAHNLEVEIRGTDRSDEIVVVGAHYDSVEGSPGANDNATGTAAVLSLARSFSGKAPSRTLRFVQFVNEEPPYFQNPVMGSWVYAKRSRERGEKIVAMLSLETIGYYTDEEDSQDYPFPLNLFYPSTGNFIAFVGNIRSRGLVRDVVSSFRRHTQFPSEGAALWGNIEGVGWSDHWSFWKEGYPAVMVTDTALFRYPEYHTSRDTPDKIQYDQLARVVAGLERVVADLAGVVPIDKPL